MIQEIVCPECGGPVEKKTNYNHHVVFECYNPECPVILAIPQYAIGRRGVVVGFSRVILDASKNNKKQRVV